MVRGVVPAPEGGLWGPCPDTTCTVGPAEAAPRSRPTPSLQITLFSDTIFIVSAVGGDGNHCCSRRRLFLGFFFFVLYSTTLSGGGGGGSWAFSPSLRSCPHLLGGKAWISPFPLSLPLKRSLSPSHLAPLLVSSPPGKPLRTFMKTDIFLVVVPARSVLRHFVLRLPKGQ